MLGQFTHLGVGGFRGGRRYICCWGWSTSYWTWICFQNPMKTQVFSSTEKSYNHCKNPKENPDFALKQPIWVPLPPQIKIMCPTCVPRHEKIGLAAQSCHGSWASAEHSPWDEFICVVLGCCAAHGLAGIPHLIFLEIF